MILLALDPGHKTTGVIRLYPTNMEIITVIDALPNERVFDEYAHAYVIVCEQIVIPGRAGRETYQTAEWFGRFQQRAIDSGIPFYGMRRPSVVNHLVAQCPRPLPKTADARVRRALKTRFSADELKGVTGHAMAALALAVTYLDSQNARARFNRVDNNA